MSDTNFQSGDNLLMALTNLGTGTALASTTGVQSLTLQVLSLNSGPGVDLSSSANSVVIGASPDPTNQFCIYDDFAGTNTLNNKIGSLYNWSVSDLSGSNINVASPGHPGIAVIGTGSSATGFASAILGGSFLYPSDGAIDLEYCVLLPTTSNASQRYTFRIGLTDGIQPDPSSSINNGFWFQYNDGPTSSARPGNWVIVSASAGKRTFIDSGVNVVGNTWYKLSSNTNAGYTSVANQINSSSTVNTTLTLPDVGQPLTLFWAIAKQVGTTDTKCQVDYIKINQQFNAAR